MAKRKTSKTNWPACKAVINDWPVSQLSDLLHELYNLNEENRRFLGARLVPAKASLDEARSELKNILSASSVYDGNFKYADAKRIIDQYAKASRDPIAVTDLLCSDLEMSLASLRQVGDFSNLVDHFYASMARLGKLIAKLPNPSQRALAKHIGDLAKKWNGKFGYGISDELNDFAAELLDRLKSHL